MKRSTIPYLAFALALISAQCIKKPEHGPLAPQWETQLGIPIANIRVVLDSMIVKDTSKVKRDLSGGFYYSNIQESAPTGLDTVKVQPESKSAEVGIGLFKVSAIPPLGFSVTAADLGVADYPFPFFPGGSTTLPAGSIDNSSQFDFLAVNQGSLTLTITNTLPVTVVFPNPIVLRNSVSSNVVASFAFDSLQEGESKLSVADLAGLFVEGALETDAVGVNFSSRSGPFSVPPGSSLDFDFSSSEVVVDSASALIPSQQITSFADSVITIDDSVVVSRASFSNGGFVARIVNDLGVTVSVALQFDNFENNTTLNPLEIVQDIAPRTTANFPFSLLDYDMVDNDLSLLGTQVTFSAHIESINSTGQKAVVTKNDFIRAEFLPESEFVVQQVTGKIPPQVIPIDAAMGGLDLDEATEKLSGLFAFDSVQIDVDFGLTGGFPLAYSFYLEGKNSASGLTARIPPAPTDSLKGTITPSADGFARISIGNTEGLSAFLSTFFPSYPDSFYVRGVVTVNPDFSTGTIEDATVLQQRVHVYFPLKFGLSGGEIVEPVELDNEDTFPEDFVSDVKQGSLRFSIYNGMPMRMGVKARFAGPLLPDQPLPRGDILTLPSDGSSLTVLAANVDAGGSAIDSVLSEFLLTLTLDDVRKIVQADSLYVTLSAQTSGDGTQPVRFRGSDFMNIRLSGNFVYIVNNQEGE